MSECNVVFINANDDIAPPSSKSKNPINMYSLAVIDIHFSIKLVIISFVCHSMRQLYTISYLAGRFVSTSCTLVAQC